jgi:hypothetical protein
LFSPCASCVLTQITKNPTAKSKRQHHQRGCQPMATALAEAALLSAGPDWRQRLRICEPNPHQVSGMRHQENAAASLGIGFHGCKDRFAIGDIKLPINECVYHQIIDVLGLFHRLTYTMRMCSRPVLVSAAVSSSLAGRFFRARYRRARDSAIRLFSDSELQTSFLPRVGFSYAGHRFYSPRRNRCQIDSVCLTAVHLCLTFSLLRRAGDHPGVCAAC